ncbi:MAG: InlB B-repeat-containing protein [Treponema sp.]|jgi:uncharacterized repeat protein (TIGR02543 family)|nr:InlB B-repeat-containing protein [Treponema sp.]
MKRRDNMNTKVIRMSALCVLVSLATLFTACEVLGPEPAPVVVAAPDEKALVSVRVGMWGRTVMPTVGLEYVDSWELLGAKAGNQEDSLLVFTTLDENTTIALEPGTWSFTLTGVRAGVLALSGSIEDKAISLEGENILAFEVASVESGEGTVNLVIELPAGSGITEAKVFKDGIEHGSPIAPDNNGRIVFKEAFNAGEYYFSIRLFNEDDKLLGVVSEIVYVWANLESAKTYTLLQKDLNLTYTISYHVPDGTMSPDHYQIATAVTLAAPLPRDGYYFKGWYEQADFSGSAVTRIPVGSTGDKAFYSKWIPETLSGYSLEDALALISGAEAGEAYTITLNADESFAPTTLSYGGAAVSITLKGDAVEQIVSLSSKGSLFTLGSGVTLKLGDNITLEGLSNNSSLLVAVNSGGKLEMNDGAKISGNNNGGGGNGGGVVVNSGGTFTMSGGEISGNTASWGGGVYVSGTFTMTGGVVSGNRASKQGGGVFLHGTFTMTGGVVSGNTSANSGGGVNVRGTFTMSGGEVSNNSAKIGGGVHVDNSGTIIKASGGVIYGSDAGAGSKNTASSGTGHAVYVVSGSKKRDSTVEKDETLYSAKSGAEGGWE